LVTSGISVRQGVQVPVDAAGKLSLRATSMLLLEVSKFGKRTGPPWVGMLQRASKTKKEVPQGGVGQLFSVPIDGALGRDAIRVYSFDRDEHRKEVMGKALCAALDVQLNRSPMTAPSRELGLTLSADRFYRDDLDRDKLCRALCNSMCGASKRRVEADYLGVGALSQASHMAAQELYLESCNICVKAFGTLQLFGASVLKKWAAKARDENAPHFKVRQEERSQKYAGVGGSMKDSHLGAPDAAQVLKPRKSSIDLVGSPAERDDQDQQLRQRQRSLRQPAFGAEAEGGREQTAAQQRSDADLIGDSGGYRTAYGAAIAKESVRASGGSSQASSQPSSAAYTAQRLLEQRASSREQEIADLTSANANLTKEVAIAQEAKRDAVNQMNTYQKQADDLRHKQDRLQEKHDTSSSIRTPSWWARRGASRRR
jgi:hypothetical protein